MATLTTAPCIINLRIVNGGTLGTMSVTFHVAGVPFQTYISVAGASWDCPVPGSEAFVTFPAGTYIANDLYSWPTGYPSPTHTGAGPIGQTIKAHGNAAGGGPDAGSVLSNSHTWP